MGDYDNIVQLGNTANDTAGLIYGIYSDYKQNSLAKDNLSLSKEAFEYQKWLHATMMSREDSAVQRRVADLQKAGFHPSLAAGSPASSQGMTSGPAPQRQSTLDSRMAVQQALGNLGMNFASIKNMNAQTNKLDAEAESIRNETGYSSLSRPVERQLLGLQVKDLQNRAGEGFNREQTRLQTEISKLEQDFKNAVLDYNVASERGHFTRESTPLVNQLEYLFNKIREVSKKAETEGFGVELDRLRELNENLSQRRYENLPQWLRNLDQKVYDSILGALRKIPLLNNQ